MQALDVAEKVDAQVTHIFALHTFSGTFKEGTWTSFFVALNLVPIGETSHAPLHSFIMEERTLNM